MTDQIKRAKWAETGPDTDGETRYWAVGKHVYENGGIGPIVTAITVQMDMRGPMGWLERVCVWHGEDLLAEAPLHNMQAVGYEVAR